MIIKLFCLNLKNGEIVWNHIGNLEEVSIIGGSKPAAINNTVVISYSSGEICALDENDGSLKWFDNVGSSNFFQGQPLMIFNHHYPSQIIKFIVQHSQISSSIRP